MTDPSRVIDAPTPAPDAVGASASHYFALVLVFSLPFYALGATGDRLAGLSILPSSALMTFVPMTVALILVYRQRGIASVMELLKRVLELRGLRHPGWLLTALLFMPIVCLLEFGVLRFTGNAVPLPDIVPSYAVFLFVALFIGAIGEELGWQGYAYPALRRRLGVLQSATVLGAVWALWHVIPFAQLGRTPEWILWHSLSAVALRIIIVWLFENTGMSILVAVVFHTMINLSWTLFPIAGSYYDPFVSFVILSLAVGLIIALWRPPGRHALSITQNNFREQHAKD